MKKCSKDLNGYRLLNTVGCTHHLVCNTFFQWFYSVVRRSGANIHKVNGWEICVNNVNVCKSFDCLIFIYCVCACQRIWNVCCCELLKQKLYKKVIPQAKVKKQSFVTQKCKQNVISRSFARPARCTNICIAAFIIRKLDITKWLWNFRS